jgi:CRISPR-associated protein Cas1
MNELAPLLEASGLDPALGMLHELDPNRPSLALDLMEPFRAPVADRFVLTSVNRAVFQPNDFSERDDHGSTILKPAAMRTFFESYEHWMHEPVGAGGDKPATFRLLLRREVENLCRALQGHADFAPYLFDAPEIPQEVHA